MNMEVDTGAAITIVSKETLKKKSQGNLAQQNLKWNWFK